MRERSRWVKVTIDEKEPLWKCQYKGEKGASRQSQQRDKVLHPIRCHSPPSITNTENLFTYSISCIHTAGTTPPDPCQPRLPHPSSLHLTRLIRNPTETLHPVPSICLCLLLMKLPKQAIPLVVFHHPPRWLTFTSHTTPHHTVYTPRYR